MVSKKVDPAKKEADEKKSKEKAEKDELDRKKKEKEEEEKRKADEEARLPEKEKGKRGMACACLLISTRISALTSLPSSRFSDIRLNIALLRRAVEQKDSSLYSRVLRQTVVIRRQLRYESLVSISKPYAHGLETDPLQYVKPVLVRALTLSLLSFSRS
jgi:hypothetical protein